jgi:ribulose-bisphosphate carboxylase large chain
MQPSSSVHREEIRLFSWRDGLDSVDYVEAVYDIETPIAPEQAAISIAREQSTTTQRVPGVIGYDLGAVAARVKSVETIGEVKNPCVPGFWLDTLSYSHLPSERRTERYWRALVRIAFPVANCGASITNIWNVVGCEVHRMGFLNAVRLVDLDLPDELLTRCGGPSRGLQALREGLGVFDRPLLCRPSLPVGLGTQEMVRIGEQVLLGGFDMVKDDELTFDSPVSPFRERVRAMVEMKKRVEDLTGKRKYYIANVIDGPLEAMELADIAVEEGADGLLVAPALQGLEIAAALARRTGAFIFEHPAWADVSIRHPRFGVSPALACKLHRLSGADLVSLPGDFATPYGDPSEARACIAACTGPLGGLKASLPVMFGGKRPEGYPEYVEAAAGNDFMIIATNAVDAHPGGIAAGARAFREAWDALTGLERVRNLNQVR